MSFKILLFVLLLSVIIKSYDNALISDLTNSSSSCVKKLSPILQYLSDDEQKLYSSSTITSSDSTRCFDTSKVKSGLADVLHSTNAYLANQIGDSLNKQIKDFGCVLNSSKPKLEENYYQFIVNMMNSITPYGIYPSFTGCLATFIQNTNYILGTRRRYLLTTIKNIEALSIKNSDGNVKGFPYKKDERSTIVNEFVRLEVCINNFASGVTNTFVMVKKYIANSKNCGVITGKYDMDLFGYNYTEQLNASNNNSNSNVDKNVINYDTSNGSSRPNGIAVTTPAVAPAVVANTAIAVAPPVTTVPQVLPAPTATVKSSSSTTSSVTATVTREAAISTSTVQVSGISPAKVEIDTSTTTNNSFNSIKSEPTTISYPGYTTTNVNPNPTNDPCFDWPAWYTANPNVIYINDTSSTTDKSALLIAPDIQDQKTQIDTKKFCPNFMGKDLSVYETYIYYNLALSDVFNNKDFIDFAKDFSKSITGQSNSSELLNYFTAGLSGKYQRGTINPNLLNDMKSQIKDTDGILDKVSGILDGIKNNGIKGINDFNIVCSNKVCYCNDCSPTWKGKFSYLREQWYNSAVSSNSSVSSDKKAVEITSTSTPSTPTSTPSESKAVPPTDVKTIAAIAPPENSENFYPSLFNIYLTKTGDKFLYMAMWMEPYGDYLNLDIKYINSGSNTISSIVNDATKQKKKCIIENLSNTNPSSCPNDPFSDINVICRDSLTSSCSNLSKFYANIYPEKAFVDDCDITKINVDNKASYDAFKDKCFTWINNNFIDGTISLNLNAIMNVANIIGNGSFNKNLRYLQSQTTPSTTLTFNDSDDVDNDKDANVKDIAQTGSRGILNIDGSAYSSSYYGPVALSAKADASPKALSAASPTVAGGGVATSASNSYVSTSQSYNNKNGPPSLVNSNNLRVLVELFVLAFSILL